MLVSIITPTSNSALYLKKNIRSILNQSYDAIEHIVIDNASTDDTVKILKSHPSIKWMSEPDDGMYDAINKGIRMASGEIIAYLNADDRYFPETVKTVVEEFSENPDLDFIFGYCTYISAVEEAICTFRPLPFIRSPNKRVRITYAQPSCFWRGRVHDRVGYFDDGMVAYGDADFFYRVRFSGLRGKLIRKPLSQFMVRGDCLSKTLRENAKSEYACIRERYNLNSWRWSYVVNEILYFSFNVDSYSKYFIYKINRLKKIL